AVSSCSTLFPYTTLFRSLLVADLVDLACRIHDARVGGEDTVDVGVDLTHIGVEGRGKSHGRGVGAAATERGDVLRGLADALESRNDGNVSLVEGRTDPTGCDIDDAGLAEMLIGDDSGL